MGDAISNSADFMEWLSTVDPSSHIANPLIASGDDGGGTISIEAVPMPAATPDAASSNVANVLATAGAAPASITNLQVV